MAEIFGFRLSGFLRVVAVADDLPDQAARLLHPDIVQLKTDKALGVGREHFEAGEVIVREGDPGDQQPELRRFFERLMEPRPGPAAESLAGLRPPGPQ